MTIANVELGKDISAIPPQETIPIYVDVRNDQAQTAEFKVGALIRRPEDTDHYILKTQTTEFQLEPGETTRKELYISSPSEAGTYVLVVYSLRKSGADWSIEQEENFTMYVTDTIDIIATVPETITIPTKGDTAIQVPIKIVLPEPHKEVRVSARINQRYPVFSLEGGPHFEYIELPDSSWQFQTTLTTDSNGIAQTTAILQVVNSDIWDAETWVEIKLEGTPNGYWEELKRKKYPVTPIVKGPATEVALKIAGDFLRRMNAAEFRSPIELPTIVANLIDMHGMTWGLIDLKHALSLCESSEFCFAVINSDLSYASINQTQANDPGTTALIVPQENDLLRTLALERRLKLIVHLSADRTELTDGAYGTYEVSIPNTLYVEKPPVHSDFSIGTVAVEENSVRIPVTVHMPPNTSFRVALYSNNRLLCDATGKTDENGTASVTLSCTLDYGTYEAEIHLMYDKDQPEYNQTTTLE